MKLFRKPHYHYMPWYQRFGFLKRGSGNYRWYMFGIGPFMYLYKVTYED